MSHRAMPEQVGLVAPVGEYQPTTLTQAEIRATYFTWNEACEVLGVSNGELRAMIEFGEIPAPVKVLGKSDRFPCWQVWRYLDPGPELAESVAA
jgi:excisionase family DNA binding protein